LGGRYLGADDNAAAVAILIETARTLPPLRAHRLLFAAFNTEEPPYIRTSLMGSQHFVDHLPAEIGATSGIQAAIIMDLMGGVHWAPLQGTVFAAGAEKSPGLYARLKQASRHEVRDARLESIASSPSPLAPGHAPLAVLPVGLHLVEEIPLLGQVAFSDYDAFRNAGVPFVFLSAGRTPRYHQPSDLPDTLHYERMAATVGWLQALLHLIDQDREPYGFDADRLVFADDVASLRPLVSLAADERSKIPGTSALSLWKLKRDVEWLEQVNPDKPSEDDIARLERVSIRLQCLLADFPGCFLL
jgi:Zn-dependent M28 family amino/carboxypeptidase